MLSCSCRGLDFCLPEQPLTLEQAARLTGSDGFKAPGNTAVSLEQFVISSAYSNPESRAQVTGAQGFKAPGDALLSLMVLSSCHPINMP